MTGFKGFDSISALQGYYQSLLLLHFTRCGVFERLRKRLTAEDLAREFKWQLAPLRSCLDFLAATTGVIGRDRKGYRAVLSPEQLNGLAFQIEKFAGAYGRTALKLPDLLAGKTQGSSLVDQQSLARAFSATKDASTGLVAAMILGARPATLLDLGCGTGSLLVQLAKVDPEFHGVGVDASKPMCKVASKQAARNGVRSRVRFVCQDARDVDRLPDASALHAASLMNEMFAHGSAEAIAYLRELKERFLGRDIWLVDYYGRLGAGGVKTRGNMAHALLHDLVQVLSGQGVPPPSLKSWRAIYRAAGCQMVEAHEFSDRGLDWFIHRVRFR